jgi:hypothetical protein
VAAGGPGLDHRRACRGIRGDRFRPDLLHRAHAHADQPGSGHVLSAGTHVRRAVDPERAALLASRLPFGERALVGQRVVVRLRDHVSTDDLVHLAERTAVQPTAVEPTAVEPTAVEPTAVQPTAVQPTPVEPTAVEPVTF